MNQPSDPTYQQRCEDSASKRGAPLDECRQAFEAFKRKSDNELTDYEIWCGAWNYSKRRG